MSPSSEKDLFVSQPTEHYHLPQALSPLFFNRDTVKVASDLIGHHLVRIFPETPDTPPLILRYRIVETEAYTQNDPACHAYQKTTGRAATLYKAPGLAYVYLIYGMYHCLNVVTEETGVAGAVLFRALEPLDGDTTTQRLIQDFSQDFSGEGTEKAGLVIGSTKLSRRLAQLPKMYQTHGPGRLTKALEIQRDDFNEKPFTSPQSLLYLAEGTALPKNRIRQTTRIGISQGQSYPWRFYDKKSPWVSTP
ncbi:MAG: DNA-3-methyladenine glycosylase [Cyanobacteria bacterium]|nr:DNA-3-methyladenine glycosylase [Cyanobacteriota bacterium]